MKQEIIKEAKTVEQAITEGARELGASEEDVQVEILQEPKKGFLGIGEQPAIVKVSYAPPQSWTAVQFLEEIIGEMGIAAGVKIAEESEDAVKLEIEGSDAGLLIGYHGETLDALQYLTVLAANRKLGDEEKSYLRITLDAGGYREKREETLRSLAKRTAAKVRRTRRSVTLDPMNPSDRRVIHSEIQGETGVSTESVGNEGHRCVVIFPEGRAPSARSNEGRNGSGRDSRNARGYRDSRDNGSSGYRRERYERETRQPGGRPDGGGYQPDETETADAGYTVVKGGSEE